MGYTIGSACGSSRCDCYRCYDQRFVQNSTDSKATQLLASQTQTTWNCPAGYAGPAQCSGAYTIGSACGSSRCDCYRCYDQRFVQNIIDSNATQLLQQDMQVRLSVVALTPSGPRVAAAHVTATHAKILAFPEQRLLAKEWHFTVVARE